jgi:hypothetical protein
VCREQGSREERTREERVETNEERVDGQMIIEKRRGQNIKKRGIGNGSTELIQESIVLVQIATHRE